jgi:hypothetical protein
MSAICVRVDAKSGDRGRIASVLSYVLDPAKKNTHERLIFSDFGNLLEDSIAGITQEMRAIADAARGLDSRVSIDPFEHFVISFEDGDAATETDLRHAVAIALRHLGMEDHPFVIGAHQDTDNRHAHLGALRINPVTLKAVSIPFVVKQAEQIGALINHELGMRPMAKNRYVVDVDGNIQKLATSKVLEPNKLAEIILSAKSWSEFHARTRAIGLHYDKKGSGALINGEKASDVDRHASMPKLVKKWGVFIPAVDAVEYVYAPPPSVQRAADRHAARKELSAKQHAVKAAAYKQFKREHNEIWQMDGIPGVAKIALVSVRASEQAKTMADLRDLQKGERQDLSHALNKFLPLFGKAEVKNGIDGVVISNARPADIRAYKAFFDDNDKRKVFYRTSRTGKADFVDEGKKIFLLKTSDEAILAALQLAQVKFGAKLTLFGEANFMRRAMKLAVANGIAVANPELQHEYAAEEDRLEMERLSVSRSQYPARKEFVALADALSADRWRVTLGGDRGIHGRKDKPFSPKTILSTDQSEALTVEQVCQKWGYLERCQDDFSRAEVMLTPASDSLHIVQIGDVSEATLDQLRADGFSPCAVVQSSPNNHHVLLTTPKILELSEKQNSYLAKRVSQMLNKHYGKATTNDAVQSFRAPGFKNMTSALNGSCPTVALIHAKRGDCAKLAYMLQRVSVALSIAKKTVPVVVDVAPVTQPNAAIKGVRNAGVALLHLGWISSQK